MELDDLLGELNTPETKKLANAINRALRADTKWLYKLLNTAIDTNAPSVEELLEEHGFMEKENPPDTKEN